MTDNAGSDIGQLMSKSPHLLNDAEIKKIVAVFREARHIFNTTKKPMTRVTPKSAEAVKAAGEMKDVLKGLGL